MGIMDIKDNADRLSELDKGVLEDYVEELLINNKRKESKIISLRTEIKYYKRQLDKVKRLIEKTIKSDNYKDDEVWGDKQ